ncbi:MAG TPA: EAL domain-containing protein [Planococcus sp. (in: firmicutes)]|nr:EAL domain-containing protein [Planococcus sp. (in: firmicutes)]
MEKANEEFQEWMDTIDEFMITIDESGMIKKVNKAWKDFCSSHDIRESLWKTGENYFEELEIGGKEAEILQIKKVLSYEIDEFTQLSPFLLRNSETRWLEIKVRGIKPTVTQAQGAIIYHKPITLHTTQPITAETVLESMTEGFCLLDDDLQLIYVNEIGEELLQCKRGTAVGRELFDLFPEAIDTHFQKHYEYALKTQEIVEFVDYYKPLDTWFQVKAFPLKKGGLSLYFQDVSERIKTEAQLTEFAYYDYLTGLPNRKLMNQKIQSLLEKGVSFSVLHLNIDNLNIISAIHPHNAGETIMKKIAEELKEFSRDTCHIGRLEGNEFIILREASKEQSTEEFVEEIEEIFYKPILLCDSETVSVSVSVGIACAPFDSQDRDELLSYADMAMGEAKKIGGSSCIFFRQSMKDLQNRKALIELGLSGDLEANGFYFTLQPQVDMTSGNITGVEVLSRWNHPQLGELPATEFIQLAEENGDIFALTIHLITEVFTHIKEWEKEFGWNLRTAINMTPSLLSNPDFFESFFQLIDLHQVNPDLIELEITEQAELTYSPKTLENLLLCKSKGISIAIDDFGTGFSIISYLMNFPITKIKIDTSFVQKIGHDPKTEAILKSLIYLAKSIECELVAEGVERAEEAEFLLANNCNVVQGYLYDKPLTVSDFEAKYLVARHNFLPEKQTGSVALEINVD